MTLLLCSGSALAATQYLRDGAKQNDRGGWTLPKQGTCPADLNQTSRPDCLALRLNIVQGSCVAPNYSWTTAGVCNDLQNNTLAACQAVPGRLWNAGTNVCAISLKGHDRNNVQCLLEGGSWVTAGTCTGSWVMPNADDSEYNMYGETTGLLTGTRGAAASVGDQCLRCHNDVTQYNGYRVRDVQETLMMGHKNMSRPVDTTTHHPWGGPDFSCSNPIYTTQESCLENNFTWDPTIYPSDSNGNTFNWTTSEFNYTFSVAQYTTAGVYPLKWVFGDWLAPLPRVIYEGGSYTGGSNVGKPVNGYSCARCHTTGWTSDATINTAKLPEKTLPGITWDGVTMNTTGKVNLAGGVAGDTNVAASWDVWGISCTRCHGSAIDNTTNGGVPPFTSPANRSSHQNNMTLAEFPGACTVSGKRDPTSCAAGGGTWNYGFCTDAKTVGGTNPAVAKTTCEASTTTPGSGNGVWVTPCSDNNYGNQAACTGAGATWSLGTASCSVQGVCSVNGVPNPAITDSAACTAASGSWAAASDLFRCVDIHEYGKENDIAAYAAARWTGTFTQRGQVITGLCVQCHRQENKGYPWTNGGASNCSNATSTNQGDCVAAGGTWTDPGGGAPLKVTAYHNTIDFNGHPHSNQFLNSPHAKFTGKWMEVPTGNYDAVGGTGLYKSAFMGLGEAANTGNGCTGCHDVHQSVVANEEPFHEECAECHTNITQFRHVAGDGTPFEKKGSHPCMTCHMPHGMHLFRINSDAAYSTFPVATAMNGQTNANTAPDGTFTNAVWVDVDYACGQCHGGGTQQASTTGSITAGLGTLTVANVTGFLPNEHITIPGAGAYVSPGVYEDLVSYIKTVVKDPDPAVTGTITLATGAKATATVTNGPVTQNATDGNAPYNTKAQLAMFAKNMHEAPPPVFTTTFTYTTLGLTINVDALVACDGPCPPVLLDWNWFDGTPHGTADPDSHTYATAGRKQITLTVTLASNGDVVGTSTRWINLSELPAPPVPTGSFSWNPDTWTATLVDTSSDPNGNIGNILVTWGDGSSSGGYAGGTFTHTYTAVKVGGYPVTQKACDTTGLCATAPYGPVNPATFLISGTVKNRLGTLGLGGATVTVTKIGFSKWATTAADGTFTVTGLKPATYNVKVTKFGYTFANPAAVLTVGPDSTGNIILATAP